MRRRRTLSTTALVLALTSGATVIWSAATEATAKATVTKKTTKPTTPFAATVQVVRTYPHDSTAFTQGLEVRGDDVYESTGLYGSSDIRRSSLRTGEVKQRVALDASLFAEGMTLLPDGRIVQITWREKVAVFRDSKTLAETSRVPFPDEGWGLCYSSVKKAVIHSDGSNVIRLRDPKTLETRSSLNATFPDGTAPSQLNELECVGSAIYANVWTTKTILKIDLNTGQVVQTIDASKLGPANHSTPDDVMNGIAALPNGNFLLTGKRWPQSYEVKVVPVKGS